MFVCLVQAYHRTALFPTLLFYDLFVFSPFLWFLCSVLSLCFIFFFSFFLLFSSFFFPSSLSLSSSASLTWKQKKQNKSRKVEKEGKERKEEGVTTTAATTQQTATQTTTNRATTKQETIKQATTTTPKQQHTKTTTAKQKQSEDWATQKQDPQKKGSPNCLQIAHGSKIGPKIAHSPQTLLNYKTRHSRRKIRTQNFAKCRKKTFFINTNISNWYICKTPGTM